MDILKEQLDRTKELMEILNEREIVFTQILDDTKKEKEDGIHRIERSEDITDVTNHYMGKESSSDYPIIPGDGTIKFVYVQGSTRDEKIKSMRIETKESGGGRAYTHTVIFDLDKSEQDRSMGNTIGAHIEITGLESGYHQVIMPLENYWVEFEKE